MTKSRKYWLGALVTAETNAGLFLITASDAVAIAKMFLACLGLFLFVMGKFRIGKKDYHIHIYCRECQAYWSVRDLMSMGSCKGSSDLECPSCHKKIARKSKTPEIQPDKIFG